MENKDKKVSFEYITGLAKKVYDLDTEVYNIVGSSLGRTFTGDPKKCVDDLAKLMYTYPQGYKLRSEIALIGNMARTIRDKNQKHRLMKEYNNILKEVEELPLSFGSVDIIDENMAELNSSITHHKFSENDHLIICISRAEGSAGTDIGFALADELRISYYDAEVFEQMLKNMEDEKDSQWQTKKVALHNSKVRDLSRYHGLPKKDAAFFNESELLCELAKQQDFIVIGRCADAILANNNIPHISVFITAPFEQRVHRFMQLENLTYKKAIKKLIKLDLKREKYYKFYSGKRWGNASNYDLCINSASYGIQESVELIKRIINREGNKNNISEK